MAKIQAISDGNGGYIYPVTIANAIIDPETGEPAQLGGSDMVYTITAGTGAGATLIEPDSNGNFTVTAADLGAAAATHSHAVSDITGLQDALDGKSGISHTHDMVSSIVVGGSTVSGEVQIVGTGNVAATRSGNTITLSITPFTSDVGSTFADGNPGDGQNTPAPAGIFTGTREEWDAFKVSGMSNGQRYIVFIRN